MSQPVSDLITCGSLQAQLNDHFSKTNPATLREPTPLIEFITSPTNTSNIIQNQIAPGNGKLRTVELAYESRFLESEVSTDATMVCISDNEGGQKSQLYQLDPEVGVSIDRKFSLADLSVICEEDGSYIYRQIQMMMDAAIRKMATVTWGQVPALIGKFGPGVTPNVSEELVVKTKKATSGDPDTDAIEKIRFASKDALYGSVPYIFGYGETDLYFHRINAGCCAASGIDIGSDALRQGMVFFSDYRAEEALGANHFITLAAGALQLLTYNSYMGAKGIRVIDTDVYKQTIIKDPETGINFDFNWKFDCGFIHVQVKLAHKLVGAPADMFEVGDRLEGVTRVNEYLITNP